jgi:hypothetical protein
VQLYFTKHYTAIMHPEVKQWLIQVTEQSTTLVKQYQQLLNKYNALTNKHQQVLAQLEAMQQKLDVQQQAQVVNQLSIVPDVNTKDIKATLDNYIKLIDAVVAELQNKA